MARLSYENIKKQIARLEAQAKTLEAARDENKARAVERVRALMKKLGVEMSDLEAAPGPARRRRTRPGTAEKAPGTRATKARSAKKASREAGARVTLPAKFRDPASGATWSGRGRTPVWLAAYLAQGKTRDAFAVVASAEPS